MPKIMLCRHGAKCTGKSIVMRLREVFENPLLFHCSGGRNTLRFKQDDVELAAECGDTGIKGLQQAPGKELS